METLELVDQLRDWAEVQGFGTYRAILTEAADRLEALDREVEQLRERVCILLSEPDIGGGDPEWLWNGTAPQGAPSPGTENSM